MIDARRAAWQLLRAVDAGRLFEAARDQALSGLNERDRRLAQEIAAGVLRRRRTLDRELIAVLRRVVEDIRGASTLAARYSHPDWLVGRWLARYGSASTETLLAHYNQPPPLVIQAARWPRERLERALTAADVDWREAPGGYGLIVRRSRPQALPGFEDGGFIVQGPGQARLLAHAAIPAGARVWDCCAAPGGKAVALSRRGPVLASDRGSARLARLVETVRRGGPAGSGFAAGARPPPPPPRPPGAPVLSRPPPP